MVLHDDIDDFVKSFNATYQEHDLSRMIAGYAWKWIFQGYDLSYAYVIIGNDLQLDEKGRTPIANRASYYDQNGSATASQEELSRYIRNIYYVLLTRGILGTHIYVANPELRKYFQQYFPSEGKSALA